MPGTRKWRPGVLGTAGSVTEAIYGLILATSVIVVSREYVSRNAGLVAVTVLTTSVVFWLGHVYARTLAKSLTDARIPRRSEAGALLRHDWPLVEVTAPLVLVLALGALDILSDEASILAAMLAAVGELAGTGGYAARIAGAGVIGTVLSGAVAAGLGAVVVLLKVLVH